MDKSTWLLGGLRSPFGKFGGVLRDVDLVSLGGAVVRSTLDSLEVTNDVVDEMLVGIGMIEGGLMVPARQIAHFGGLRDDLPTLTIDRACCTGATLAGMAARSVQAGEDLVVTLGVETLSRTPRLLHDSRWGQRLGDVTVEDLLLLRSPLAGRPIAAYVGEVALEYGVSREDQDRWAMDSHARYFRALDEGFFEEEIVAVPLVDGETASNDEPPRRTTSLEKLANLPCVYGSPTVTPGNAPALSDGACALVFASDRTAEKLGRQPLARVADYRQLAGDPISSAYLPGQGIRQVLESNSLSLDDVDVIEINEAFAATPVVSIAEMCGDDKSLRADVAARTNSNGGAVALGHPLAASGARLVLTASRRLAACKGRWAVVAICGGFGQADIVLLERPDDK